VKYAIFSDIHSNLTAFQAVLNDLQKRGGADEYWCLGDIVGYGPDPHECIALLRQQRGTCVAGNHDWAAVGKLDTGFFNPEAARAADWTARQLEPEEALFLSSLPIILEIADFTLVHGTPRDPLLEYLLSSQTASENLGYLKTRYSLVGHSHQPLIFECQAVRSCQLKAFPPDTALELKQNSTFINPGSVGQPRDGDPRASYAVYDTGSRRLFLHRVEYDVASVQERMSRANLPLRLITRLAYGI
jgi:predicted phosphodiesterase